MGADVGGQGGAVRRDGRVADDTWAAAGHGKLNGRRPTGIASSSAPGPAARPPPLRPRPGEVPARPRVAAHQSGLHTRGVRTSPSPEGAHPWASKALSWRRGRRGHRSSLPRSGDARQVGPLIGLCPPTMLRLEALQAAPRPAVLAAAVRLPTSKRSPVDHDSPSTPPDAHGLCRRGLRQDRWQRRGRLRSHSRRGRLGHESCACGVR